MTGKEAVEAALAFGTSARGKKPPKSAATATEVAFQTVTSSLPETNDARIAPSRCVWLVKVNSTLRFHTGPPGAPVHRAPSYSVLYDVNSGFMFEVVPEYPATAARQEH
jgi:hypothetical protein